MTHQLDQKFLNAIESLKKYDINVNPNGINRLYKAVNLYQQDRNNPEYPLCLVLREMGHKTHLPVDKIDEQLSDDISTIVFENYFTESKDQTLSHILREIQRISKNNFSCNVLNETAYDEDGEQTSVTINCTVLDKTFELTHEDEYGDGSLLEGFLTDKLLPALKGSITKGHILYTCEFSINLIYFENDKYFELFKEDFNYYKEI